MVEQDPQLAPQTAKKKRKKEAKKGGQTKAADAGPEGFVDWTDLTTSESAKERRDDMSSLAARFAAWMCKQAASTKWKTPAYSKVYGGKRPKRLSQMKRLRRARQ